MFASLLAATLDQYQAEVADESDDLALLLERLAAGDALDDRRTLPGHVTTSAIVLDPAGDRVLLVFHRALGRWLQPGGHWEPAPGIVPRPALPPLASSAAREVQEETGLAGLSLHPWHKEPTVPVDIDIHPIPAHPRRGEPAHWHFDLRFAFVAPPGAGLTAQEDEVSAVAWKPVRALDPICPRAVRRLAGR